MPISTPPAAATSTTIQGAAFHAVSITKQVSAGANWRGPTMALAKDRIVMRRAKDADYGGMGTPCIDAKPYPLVYHPFASSFRRYAVSQNTKREALMTERHQSNSRERMTIFGDLDAVSFVPWIRRHAAKLGLSPAISHTSSRRIELEVVGPADLIDMMELGCSLGPIDVWVATIHRTPVDSGTD